MCRSTAAGNRDPPSPSRYPSRSCTEARVCDIEVFTSDIEGTRNHNSDSISNLKFYSSISRVFDHIGVAGPGKPDSEPEDPCAAMMRGIAGKSESLTGRL